MNRTALFGVLLAIAACGEPQPCQPDGTCPPPLTCYQGVCQNTLGKTPTASDASADASCPTDPLPGAVADAAFAVFQGELALIGGHAGRPRCSPSAAVAARADAVAFAPCGGFRALPPVPGTRYGAMATTGPDGALYVVGGRRDLGPGSSNPLGDTWRLAPGAGTWAVGAGDIPGRSHGALTSTNTPRALWQHGGDIGVQPGVPAAIGALRRLDLPIVAPDAPSWELVPEGGDAPGPRRGHTLLGRPQALVLLGGAAAGGALQEDVFRFDIAAGKWERIDIVSEAPTPRAFAATAWLADGQILLFGGIDAEWGPRNDLWRLDLTAGTWTRLRAGDLGQDGQVEGTIGAAPSACNPPADILGWALTDPERRGGGALMVTSNLAWLFSGAGACGGLGDLWRLDLQAMQWVPLRTGGPRAACPYQQPGCSLLCLPGL